MEIWIVERGDKYEGAYQTDYFFKEKDAVKFARETYKIDEFTMRGHNYLNENKHTHEYVYIYTGDVK
jgi:hypothetical protein